MIAPDETGTVLAAVAAAGAAALLPAPLPRMTGGPSAPVVAASPRRLPIALGAASAVLSVALATGAVAPRHVVLLLIVGGAFAFGLRLNRRRRARLHAGLAADRVVALCEQVGGDLAAGQSPSAAFRAAAATWPEVAEVARSVELGADPVRVLRLAAVAPGREGLRAVAAAVALADSAGAPVVPVLDRVSRSLRAGRETARLVEGELASARATARLVALLPFAALLLGRGTGSDPLGFLLGGAAGLTCLAAGLALACAGIAWIDALADHALRPDRRA